jgi:hypothetical protein
MAAQQFPRSARLVRSKYNSVKVQIDGITFDSKAEARRYAELKLLESIGDLDHLELQKKFLLVPSKRNADGYLEREVTYIADFVYIDREGNTVVEDTKSPVTRTKDYVIKRKLMLHVHGITIREIGVKQRKVTKQ